MPKAKAPRWTCKRVIGERQLYARQTRSEIIVRVEKVGDTTKYAEWGMPKMLGLLLAMETANSQTEDEAIKP